MSDLQYHEVQGPHIWVWLMLLLAGGAPLVLLQGAPLWPTVAPTLVCLLLVLLFMPLRTTVSAGRLRVAYGLLPLFVWSFSLADVEAAEVVTYRPLRTYMGWGMRRGFDGSRCLTMRGSRGVMLILRGGRRQLIGSQRPQELAEVLT